MGKEEVEDALREKLMFAKYAMQDLLGRCVCVSQFLLMMVHCIMLVLFPIFSPVFHCLHRLAAPIRVRAYIYK